MSRLSQAIQVTSVSCLPRERGFGPGIFIQGSTKPRFTGCVVSGVATLNGRSLPQWLGPRPINLALPHGCAGGDPMALAEHGKIS